MFYFVRDFCYVNSFVVFSGIQWKKKERTKIESKFKSNKKRGPRNRHRHWWYRVRRQRMKAKWRQRRKKKQNWKKEWKERSKKKSNHNNDVGFVSFFIDRWKFLKRTMKMKENNQVTLFFSSFCPYSSFTFYSSFENEYETSFTLLATSLLLNIILKTCPVMVWYACTLSVWAPSSCYS